jgi:UDP-glucose 4-epimerase
MNDRRGVVITGGAGFIGSHVADALQSAGVPAMVIDNLQSGNPSNLSPNVPLVVDDAARIEAWPDQAQHAAAIVHLAAMPAVQDTVERPLESHTANFVLTQRLVEAARRYGIPRIVYASTAAVYGNLGRAEQHEDDPIDPLTPYAIDKHAGERYLKFAEAHYGIETVTLRFFNVYGPRQNPSSPYSGVLTQFAGRLIEDRPLVVYGDGHQTRDFVYVGDIARIVANAATRQARWPAGPINVGTGQAVSLNQVIDTFARALGVTPHVRFEDARPGDVRDSKARIGRLKDAWGDAPNTELDRGLDLLLTWMREANRA